MSDTQIVWRRVSRGIHFIGLGAFLLLCTQGVLPWSFWREALPYWPVLLVGLGLRMIFERTRAPALILLSPLVVLGTLAYVSRHPAQPAPPDWTRVGTARPEKAKRWTLAGSLGMAELDLQARHLPKNRLVEGRVTAGDRHRLDLGGSREEPRVRLGTEEPEWSLLTLAAPGHDQRWDLALSQELPLDVNLELAFAGGQIDLASAPVADVEIEGAFNDLTLRLGAPRTDTRLAFHGAFNQIKVIVPGTTPVRVNSDGFLNWVDGRPEPAKGTGPVYRVEFEGAFNRLAVRSP